MGFFSWKAADSKESILNVHTGLSRPVYLLQPHGKPPIEESAYEGSGIFGGVDVYLWLPHAHGLAGSEAPDDIYEFMESASPARLDDLRSAGVSMDVGFACYDTQSNEIHTVFHELSPRLAKLVASQTGLPIHHHRVSYATPLPGHDGKTANDLISAGVWEQRSVRSLLGGDLPYPLKFSFNPSAIYEDLPASENCPNQGIFEEDSEESPINEPGDRSSSSFGP